MTLADIYNLESEAGLPISPQVIGFDKPKPKTVVADEELVA